MRSPNELFTLSSLCRLARAALSVGYEGQANGQIREVPDERTIRYYTTLGLVDRPAAMRGRTALYAVRHLMQIVAIKRLQARGLRLAAIQRELIGIPDRALARLAQLPPGIDAREEAAQSVEASAAAGPAPTAGATGRAAFWRAEPADALDVARGSTAEREGRLTLIELSRGVHVLVQRCGRLAADDVAALRAAAAPLVRLLDRHRCA